MPDHMHGPNGEVIIAGPPTEEEASVEAQEVAAGADVQIAEINAARDVQVAKTDLKRAEIYSAEEVAEMRGKLAALEQVVQSLQPPAPEPPAEAEPAPVIVEAPPQEETAPAPAPAESTEPPPEKEKKSKGFWGSAYS